MIRSRCITSGQHSKNTRFGVHGSCSGQTPWESTGKTLGTYINFITDTHDSFTATVPAVIQQLGYSSANAQLLTIPIYVFAMLMTIIFAFWSDRVQQRSPFIMAGYSIAAVGFIGQLAIPHTRLPGLTYGFLFPVAAGLYCPFVHIVSWTGKFPRFLHLPSPC
jgi:cyanate permease